MESEQILREEYERINPSKKATYKRGGKILESKGFQEFKKQRSLAQKLFKELQPKRAEIMIKKEKRIFAETGGLAENLPREIKEVRETRLPHEVKEVPVINLPPEIPRLMAELGIEPKTLIKIPKGREIKEVRVIKDVKEVPNI